MVTKNPTSDAKYTGLENLMKRIDELNEAIAKKKASGDDMSGVPWEVDWKSDDEMVESARQTIKYNWPIFKRLSEL